MSLKLFTILFCAAGLFSVADATAQSNVTTSDKAVPVATEIVTAPVQNPDLAPAQPEKPHVISETGEKIYFLADPGTTETTATEKKAEEQPAVTDPKKK